MDTVVTPKNTSSHNSPAGTHPDDHNVLIQEIQ